MNYFKILYLIFTGLSFLFCVIFAALLLIMHDSRAFEVSVMAWLMLINFNTAKYDK